MKKKKPKFSVTKKLVRRVVLLTVSHISLKYSSMEHNWVLIFASASNLLWCAVLVLSIGKKFSFTQIDSWKRRSILKTFSDDYWYFSLILHQHRTSSSVLKGNCSVEFETISVKFSYSVTLKSIGLTTCRSFYSHMISNI